MTETEGWWAKINRAEEHLATLDDLIGAYFKEKPYRFVGEEQTDGEWRHQSFFLEALRYPPDDIWGPVIGDAVHNLRSALDHLAWQLALPEAQAETPRLIEFPVVLHSPEDNPGIHERFRRTLKCLRKDAQAIVEAAQPYKAGDSHHPLWLLQSLWNTDKHRVIHTAGFLYTEPRHSTADAIWGYTGWHWGPFDRASPESRTHLESLSEEAEHAHSFPTLQDRVNAYENFAVDVTVGRIQWPPDRYTDPYVGLPIRQMLRYVWAYVARDLAPQLSALT